MKPQKIGDYIQEEIDEQLIINIIFINILFSPISCFITNDFSISRFSSR